MFMGEASFALGEHDEDHDRSEFRVVVFRTQASGSPRSSGVTRTRGYASPAVGLDPAK